MTRRLAICAVVLAGLAGAGSATAASSFFIRGAGFGHGVGMCQMGAIGMATAGKPHAQILAHYFRGTHLHRLY